jgi:hypothetical protein
MIDRLRRWRRMGCIFKSDWKLLFVVYLLPFVLVPRVWATNLPIDPSIATASAITPGAIIDSDLAPHTWSVHPTAGYFTGTSSVDSLGSTASVKGWGGTGQVQYSRGEHFGVEFSGMGYSGSGTYTPSPTIGSGTSGNATVSGWLIGASLVIDPFSGPDFRMPFFLGLNYQHLQSSTPTSPLVTSMSLNSPGWSVGYSPRFNVGFLRFEPFMIVSTPFRKGSVTCGVSLVAAACGPQNIQVLPIVGVDIVFRPWNFGFYFNISSFLFGSGVSFYSLGPQLRF